MTAVAVVVPPAPAGALKSWRKLVTAVRPGAGDTFGIEGPFLDADRAVELPEGALVLGCDVFPQCRTVTVYRVAGGLEALKSWERKGPLGKSVCDWARRRLAPGSAGHAAQPIEDAANLYDGRCRYCRNPVPAGTGRLWRDENAGENILAHQRGACPPPPPPPARIEPNLYGGPCFRCGGWTTAGDGAAVLTVTPAAGEKPSYAPVHAGDCPVVPEPGPRNERRGWCHHCGGTVEPGSGRWQRRPGDHARMILACYPGCATAAALDMPWWVLRAAGQDPGDVVLARVRPGTGRWDVPADAPGYRVLPGDAHLVQFAALVLETDAARKSPARRMQVRAATWEEAAGVLAAEAAGRFAAVPTESRHRAMHQAMQYLDRRPWLAEITGYDLKFGYQREFLRAEIDWRGVSKGRNAMHRTVHCWTLKTNKVYEAWRPDGAKRDHRAFLRATPEGDVEEIGREEVDGWLALLLPPAAR